MVFRDILAEGIAECIEIGRVDSQASGCFGSIPGKRYVIETSEDLRSWSPTGEPFVATERETEIRFAIPKEARVFIRPGDAQAPSENGVGQ